MKRRPYLIKATNDINKPINRKKLGPFVRGFLLKMLSTAELTDPDEWGGVVELVGFSIDDIDEPTLHQLVRECLHFHWRNRIDLEELWDDEYDDYGELEAGADFWVSKHGGDGFSTRGFELVWDRLHSSAEYGFGPTHLELQDGKIKMYWEE